MNYYLCDRRNGHHVLVESRGFFYLAQRPAWDNPRCRSLIFRRIARLPGDAARVRVNTAASALGVTLRRMVDPGDAEGRAIEALVVGAERARERAVYEAGR